MSNERKDGPTVTTRDIERASKRIAFIFHRINRVTTLDACVLVAERYEEIDTYTVDAIHAVCGKSTVLDYRTLRRILDKRSARMQEIVLLATLLS